ncbi:hypothetical protein K8942_03190 [Candidatus Peribacteria bacterium]|nr:MAG: hypothetical protein K8942_03190 [Candidatus Peribacteria bacterium]
MLRELLENGSIIDIIATFIALSLIVASILCLVFIIIGGISFILSAGNEDKIRKAVHTIRYAIIGLIVTFVAFFAVAWISRLLNIPFELNFTTIVNLMQEIFQSLGNTGGTGA